MEHQRNLRRKRGGAYEPEDYEDDLKAADEWKSTTFTTQRVFKNTVWMSRFACLLLCGAAVIAALPFWIEECGSGYFDILSEKTLGTNEVDAFAFVNSNLCGICSVGNCESCT